MRQAFARALVELAEQDKRIVLLTADLGYTVLEPFSQRFPHRFFNIGVAEQNMIGIATGLADAGFIPFVYSIVTFASLRAYEFIRNGPVLHHLPVRIVGIGGGVEYGSAGVTHHGLEDIGVMRLQPGLTVVAPADHQQAYEAIRKTWALPGPVYYRLGKDDRKVVPGLDGRLSDAGVQVVREGKDVLLLAMGAIASETVAAASFLSELGVECTVAVVSILNPAPAEALEAHLRQFPLVLTNEAHYITGGLGSLVAEIIAENTIPCQLVRSGIRAPLNGTSGSEVYLHQEYGLSARQLAETVLAALHREPTSL